MDSSHLSQQLKSVSYDQRWELLRPTIRNLYVSENKRLSEIVKIIEALHGHVAYESQYKYQIKKWGLKKSTSIPKKEAICRVVKHRAREGKNSVIKQGTKDFDIKNLHRYLKTESRRIISMHPAANGISGGTFWPILNTINFGNRIFMNWNMPYGVPRPSSVGAVDHFSPISDIQVITPTSHHDPPSPMALTIAEITAIDRAQLFVEGKHDELLQSLSRKQKAVMSTWMYQFWFYSFKTAKHWGKGPRDWTANLLSFEDYQGRSTITDSLPTTPHNMDTPTSHPTPRSDEVLGPRVSKPTSLCRWSIHCRIENYEPIPSPPGSPPRNTTAEDERRWPNGFESHNFTQKLCNNIESNGFSNLQVEKLPVGTEKIADAARRSPKEMVIESIGFSIMGRNGELLQDLMERALDESTNMDDMRPFHLAASYLDGSRKCCDILGILGEFLPVRRFYVNELGHTVLDQLMITILKAHSSCLPNVVDDVFGKTKRFEGDDVDICGRWDADSDCTRQRLAAGISYIPFEWKHMFCHTSVQAICHCICMLFESEDCPEENTKSGLFVRRCVHCGLKLQLLPLHTLIMIAYHLSVSGCDGETLFGIVACLFCLLSYNADPSRKANISFDLLMHLDEATMCSHQEMDPCDLAEQIVAKFRHSWSRNVAIAWGVIVQILSRSTKRLHTETSDRCNPWEEQQRDGNLGLSSDEKSNARTDVFPDCSCHEWRPVYFGQRRILAPLWAAIQTEFLTYRRQEERDPWISEHFDMEALLESLAQRNMVAIPLVQNKMMKPFCACGWFGDERYRIVRTTADDAAAYYFSNLEDWNRSTFLPIDPERGW